MTIIGSLRDAVTAAGGTPSSYNKVALLRQLVTALGGTPTKRDVIGLLRQAVTAAGGTPTKYAEVYVLRELLVALGAPAATFILYKLYQQLATAAASGGNAPTLGTLTLSGTLTNGTSSSGTIIGATAGSTIVSNIDGLDVNSGARTYTFDGTGAVDTYADGLTETLGGATNSPHDSSIEIGSGAVPGLTPILARTSGDGEDLAFNITFADDTAAGMYARLQLAGDDDFTTPLFGEGAIRDELVFLTSDALIDGPVFTILASQPAGHNVYGRLLIETDEPAVSDWSNTISNLAALNALTVTVGDSWYGNANPPYNGFYMGAYFEAHPEHAVLNLGKGGTGLDWWDTKRSEIAAAAPYVVISSFGRNDFMGGTYGGTDDPTKLAAYQAKYLSCIENTKDDLPGVSIICETLTEQHTANPTFNASYNGNRHAFNDWLFDLKTAGTIAEVIDIGGQATIGADGAMTIGSPESSDGTHLTEFGNDEAYTVFDPTMDNFYADTTEPEDDVSDFAITAPSAANEGNSGTTTFTFTVTRTGALTHAATVDYAVTGTGTHPAAAADFIGAAFPSGTLSFDAGEASLDLDIDVAGDATIEDDETFTVTLSNPQTEGTISTATAVGTITNDDSGGGGLTTTYRSSAAGNGGFGANFTFSSVTYYAGENIVAVSTVNSAPSAVSLGGTAGTQIAVLTTGNKTISFWQVTKGSGGSGNLVVTSVSIYSIGYALWSTDAGATFVASQSLAYDYLADPQRTPSVTMPSGGSILAMGLSESDTTTFAPEAGTSEDADFEDTGAYSFWAGHRATTGVVGLTGAAFNGFMMLAISLQP